jgi:hypothetical protein
MPTPDAAHEPFSALAAVPDTVRVQGGTHLRRPVGLAQGSVRGADLPQQRRIRLGTGRQGRTDGYVARQSQDASQDSARLLRGVLGKVLQR